MKSERLVEFIAKEEIEFDVFNSLCVKFLRWMNSNYPKELAIDIGKVTSFQKRLRNTLDILRRNGQAALIGRNKFRFFI